MISISLAAGFDVEAGLGQDDFDFIAKLRFGYRYAVHDQGQHFAVGFGAGIRVVFDAFRAEFVFGLQLLEDAGKKLGVRAAHAAHGFAAAGGFAVFFARGLETGFVHVEGLFAGDVAADFERQAVGGVQVEGFAPVEGGFASLLEFVEHALQVGNAAFHGARKTDFFPRQRV